eukprot:maker-scaffold1103_size62544-snap-gene-0.14 protein:Tk04265 transcript:maker-scaffold1103_size62544-snap-gene-0.14-mRNA-1 annotation:"mitochondrial 28s ribosomal protein s29"
MQRTWWMARQAGARGWSARGCATAVSPTASYFRTAETNPGCHSSAHLGRLYTVPPTWASPKSEEQTHNTFFPKDFQKRGEALQEHSVLVRPHVLEVFDILDNVRWSQMEQPLKFVLFGPEGVGKSVSLSHIYHRMITDPEFVVFQFGSLRVWLKRYRGLSESDFKRGQYDLLGNSRHFLNNFIHINQGKLDGLTTRKTYKWSPRESTEQGSPLMEVALKGVERPKFATDCMNILMKEMKLNSKEGLKKTAVFVDGLNMLYKDETMVSKDFPDFTRKMVSPDRLARMCSVDELSSMVSLRKLIKNDGKNLAVFSSVDRTMVFEKTKHSHWWHLSEKDLRPKSATSFPFTLLGKMGWEATHPFIPIEVSPYSPGEVDVMIDYYIEKHYIEAKCATEAARTEIKFITGGNPKEFMDLSNLW